MFSRSSLPLAALVTMGFVIWALDAPTSMGDGGYLIWTPLVFGAAWIVASLLGGILKGLK